MRNNKPQTTGDETMNTYVMMAPDYAKTGRWGDDVRILQAERAGPARTRAASEWDCDPDDIVLLAAFKGQPEVLRVGLGSVAEYRAAND